MRTTTPVILAGGLASRFGGVPKGLERVGGQRIVDRVAAALVDATGTAPDELLVVANDGAAGEWLPGALVVGDVVAGAGALGGLHAALASADGAVLVVAWDMPFVSAPLLRALCALGEREGADVALPESTGPLGAEPLCAWYAPSALPVVAALLARGERRMGALVDALRVARLPLADVRALAGTDPFLNVNTAAELAVAEAHASTTDGRHRRAEA